MPKKTPQQLSTLATELLEPHFGYTLVPIILIISKGSLKTILKGSQTTNDIIIMHLSKKMLSKGPTGAEWDTLQKSLIKHQKEIKN